MSIDFRKNIRLYVQFVDTYASYGVGRATLRVEFVSTSVADAKKNAPNEADARKTQTPTVAKQVICSTGQRNHINGIRIFTEFSIWLQKRFYSIKNPALLFGHKTCLANSVYHRKDRKSTVFRILFILRKTHETSPRRGETYQARRARISDSALSKNFRKPSTTVMRSYSPPIS